MPTFHAAAPGTKELDDAKKERVIMPMLLLAVAAGGGVQHLRSTRGGTLRFRAVLGISVAAGC